MFCRTHRERLDVPLHHVLLRNPLGASCARLELWGVSVAGHRHQDGHVVSRGAALKLTPSLSGGNKGHSLKVITGLSDSTGKTVSRFKS